MSFAESGVASGRTAEAGVAEPLKVRADAALVRAIAGTGAELVLVTPGEATLEHGIGAVLRYADASTAASRAASPQEPEAKMSEQPWGVDANNPLDEGSEPTAVGTGDLADRKAAQDPTAQDGTDVRTKDKPLAYDPDQEHEPQAGEQGGQPNLSPDPAVSGRRSNFGQGSTDDSPGTPSDL